MNPTIRPDIKINPSTSLRRLISDLKDDGVEGVPEYTEDDELDLKAVSWLFENRRLFPDGVRFYRLLKACDIVFPSPVFPPRSPELEGRISKLKAEEAEREYRNMTKNVTDAPKAGESFGQQMKEVDRYVVVIFQFIVSVVASFAFGYLSPYYLYGVTEVGFRLITGVVFGFIVAIADLYFVIKFLLESEGLITRPKKKEE